MTEFLFKTNPYQHQLEALESSHDKEEHNTNPKKNADIKNSNIDLIFISFYANLEDLD